MAQTLSFAQLEMAVRAHGRNEFEQAEQLYRQALAADAANVDAWHCGGVLALQLGLPELAVQRLQRAVELGANLGGTHFLLGRAYKAMGMLDFAIASYQRAVAVDPQLSDAYVSLGLALKDQERWEAAVSAYRQAIAINPASVEAHINLANLLQVLQQWGEALLHYDTAVVLAPQVAELHYNRGIVFRALNQHQEALESFQRACMLDSQHTQAFYNFGTTLLHLEHAEQAADCFRYVRSMLEQGVERPVAGAARDQLHLDTLTNLTAALVRAHDYEQALPLLRETLPRAVDSPVLNELLLLVLPYRYTKRDAIDAAYRHYREVMAPFDVPSLAIAPRVAASNKLRIGYVSADFRDHSVTFFLEPLLQRHDRNAFDVVCYSANPSDDTVTERLKTYADAWVDIHGLDDEELAGRMVADGIDILVDLSGRTVGNRLGVFLFQPAFLQVSYLGYPTYSGCWKIDYRLTDGVIDPDERGPDYEQPLRLPGSMFCYRPPADAPEVMPPPMLQRGTVTFGSFNTVQKLSPETIALWARILRAVPNSTLLLKANSFAREQTAQRTLAALERAGVARERVTIVAGVPDRRAHLEMYGAIDIALDTFPYNGVTTTCEALWMGVPVVTACGETHASRTGASILNAVGLHECIATSADDYVAAAVALANATEALAQLRAQLRARFAASSLRDEQAFTRNFEATLRDAWQRKENARNSLHR